MSAKMDMDLSGRTPEEARILQESKQNKTKPALKKADSSFPQVSPRRQYRVRKPEEDLPKTPKKERVEPEKPERSDPRPQFGPKPKPKKKKFGGNNGSNLGGKAESHSNYPSSELQGLPKKRADEDEDRRLFMAAVYPREDATRYSGPIDFTRISHLIECSTIALDVTVPIKVGGVGVCCSVVSNNPGDYPSLRLSDTFGRIFQSNRVLSTIFQYQPAKDGSAPKTSLPFAVLLDRRSNTALSSYADSQKERGYILESHLKPFARQARMEGLGDAVFRPNNDTLATLWLKFYGEELPADATIGSVTIFFLLQFKRGDRA